MFIYCYNIVCVCLCFPGVRWPSRFRTTSGPWTGVTEFNSRISKCRRRHRWCNLQMIVMNWFLSCVPEGKSSIWTWKDVWWTNTRSKDNPGQEKRWEKTNIYIYFHEFIYTWCVYYCKYKLYFWCEKNVVFCDVLSCYHYSPLPWGGAWSCHWTFN